jgi:hypothetical protein
MFEQLFYDAKDVSTFWIIPHGDVPVELDFATLYTNLHKHMRPFVPNMGLQQLLWLLMW